jgi:hypothetical protein
VGIGIACILSVLTTTASAETVPITYLLYGCVNLVELAVATTLDGNLCTGGNMRQSGSACLRAKVAELTIIAMEELQGPRERAE